MRIQFDRLRAVVSLAALLCTQGTLGAAAAEPTAHREVGYLDFRRYTQAYNNKQEYCYLVMEPGLFPSFIHLLDIGSEGGGNIPGGWRLSASVKRDLITLSGLQNVPPAERVAPHIESLSRADQSWLGPHLQEDSAPFEHIDAILRQQRAIERRKKG